MKEMLLNDIWKKEKNVYIQACMDTYVIESNQIWISGWSQGIKLKYTKVQQWYFVTKIVLTYCEKKLF